MVKFFIIAYIFYYEIQCYETKLHLNKVYFVGFEQNLFEFNV
jgi:hypothetical protein